MNSYRSLYLLLSSIFFHRFLYNFTPVGTEKGVQKNLSREISSFKSGYMKWHFIPWNPGFTRQRLENGDHKKNQIWRISKQHPSFLRKMLSTLYVEYYWFVSSDFPFVGEFFLSVVNTRRHFDWKCHRQPLLVTHLWRILLSWLQFYAVEQANCKRLQR